MKKGQELSIQTIVVIIILLLLLIIIITFLGTDLRDLLLSLAEIGKNANNSLPNI